MIFYHRTTEVDNKKQNRFTLKMSKINS